MSITTSLSKQGYKLKKEDLSNEHRSKIIKELEKLVTNKKYFLKLMYRQSKTFDYNTLTNYQNLIKKIQYEKI